MSVSEAEFEVMKVVWSADKTIASKEIVAALELTSDWKPKTIQTLIRRLVQKDVLGFDQQGRHYFYYAKQSEKELVDEASENFLERFFGGSLKPMLSHFAGSEKISAEEADLLRKLLDEADK